MIKKILSVLLTVLMLLGMFTLSASAVTDYEETKTLDDADKTVDSVLRTEISASLYDEENTDAEVVYNSSAQTLTVPKGKTVSFAFDVKKEGIYRVALKSRTSVSNTTVSVEGKNSNGDALSQVVHTESSISVKSTCNIMKVSTYRESIMGRFEFTEGKNTMSFTVAPDAAADVIVFGLVIKYVGTLDLSADSETLIKTPDYLYSNIPNNVNFETSSTGKDYYLLETAAYGKIMNALTTSSTAKHSVYRFDVEESGLYKIKVYAKQDNLSTSCSVRVGGSVDELLLAEYSESFSFVNDTVEENCKIADMSENLVALSEGEQFLELSIINVSGNSTIYFFTLEKAGDFQNLEKVKANGTEVTENGTVLRGSDSFELDFARAVDAETVSDETVYLACGEKKAGAELEMSGDKVYLNLTETLDYSTDYTIHVNGVKDGYGTKAENVTFSFKTGGKESDGGAGSVSVESYSNDYLSVTINAKLLSSKGIGIKGRSFTVYVKDTEGVTSLQPVFEGKSENGGAITVNYTLDDTYKNISGIYTFMIKAEYMETSTNVEINYISPLLEGEILGELKNANDVSAVEDFLENYASVFGLDPENDMENLSSDAVYGHLTGLEVSLAQDFRDIYYKSIALETVNQATLAEEIEAVLSDSVLCERLSVDKAKTDLIINERADFIAAVLGLDNKDSVKALADAIDEVANDSLASEYGRKDVSSLAEDVSSYAGQAVSVSLEISAIQPNIKKIVYNFEAENESVLKNAVVTTEAGEVTSLNENNKLCVTIERADAKAELKEIGSISLLAPDDTSKADITISGTLEFDEGIGYPIYTDITPKTIEMKTTVNSKRGSSGSSSYSSGGAVMSAPVIEQDKTENEQTGNTETEGSEPSQDCNFKDMASSAWAVDAVNTLFAEGIISDNDEKLFRPTDNVTREEFVKMIAEALDLMHGEYETSFTDVEKDKWYYPYIAVAEQNGIVIGDEYGHFRVGENITRQDMAVIIVRVIDKLRHPYGIESEIFADDAEIAGYAKTAMYAAKNMSIINGVGDNTCAPRGYATRAMAAKVIYEMIRTVGLR